MFEPTFSSSKTNSPTNTEIISSTKEGDNYNDMYVNENPTDTVMCLYEDTREYSIGI